MATVKLIFEDDDGTAIYKKTVSQYSTTEKKGFFSIVEQAREFHDLAQHVKTLVDKYYMAIS